MKGLPVRPSDGGFAGQKKGKPKTGFPLFYVLRLEVRTDNAGQIASRDLHWLDW
jgi:hypothetical protein